MIHRFFFLNALANRRLLHLPLFYLLPGYTLMLKIQKNKICKLCSTFKTIPGESPSGYVLKY